MNINMSSAAILFLFISPLFSSTEVYKQKGSTSMKASCKVASNNDLFDKLLLTLCDLEKSDPSVVKELGIKCNNLFFDLSPHTLAILGRADIVDKDGYIKERIRPWIRACFDYQGHKIMLKKYLLP